MTFANRSNRLKKWTRKTKEIPKRKSGRSKCLNSTKEGGKTSDSQLRREKIFVASEGHVKKSDENHSVKTAVFLNSKLSCRESKVMLKRTDVHLKNSKHLLFLNDQKTRESKSNKRKTIQDISKHEDGNVADVSKMEVSKEVESNYTIRNAESKLVDKENESNKSPKESDMEDGLIQRNFKHFLDRKRLDASMYTVHHTEPKLDRFTPEKVASHKKERRPRGKNRKVINHICC